MSISKGFLKSKSTQNSTEEVQWLSVSDLMAGLMMVFLLISVALIRDVKKTTNDVEDLVGVYTNTQVALIEKLHSEFNPDLERWGAKIDDKKLSFVFMSPDVLFDTGKITIKPKFKKILNNFIPRYLAILKEFDISINSDDKSLQSSFIQEVRIEGHTSSVWNRSTARDKTYFNNMWLSQGRTRSVLEHVYNVTSSSKDKKWVKDHVAAVGFSSSKIILDADGHENQKLSRRVEFSVITNSEQQLKNIMKRLKR